MKQTRYLVLTIIFCLPFSLLAERVPLKPEPHYAQIAERFAWRFPREHLAYSFMDDLISSMAWTNYISSLDYERVYFMESDIVKCKSRELELDDRLNNGDISFAFEVYETFLERVRDRYEYVDKLLAEGFDLERDESYIWKRKAAEWPKDNTDRDEIWRKKIKNEYVQRVVSMRLAEEERARVATNVDVVVTNEIADAVEESGKQPEGENLDENESVGTTGDLKDLEPEEFIRKRYKQFLTTLEDNDAEWVMEKYLSAIARAYDPHSAYMSHRSLEDFNIEMRLSLEGIGALLKAEDGIVVISQIIAGGPADKDGRLKSGDKIIAVGQGDDPAESIIHWPLQKTVGRIRGEKGTKVVLTIIPASDPTGSTTKQIELFRDEVKLEEQEAKLKKKEAVGSDGVVRNVGVIVLPAFYANMEVRSTDAPEYKSSAHDVDKLLAQAVEEGLDGLVLDLRNNGGGSLTEAVSMTGLFIKTGPTVQVKERRMIPLVDDDPRVAYAGPLVVLVDRRSASASEIVAGALQDYGRAVIVGDSKTHGKGTVQTITKLGYSDTLGRIKMTCSMFYRVTGSSTQLKGVLPDIVISSLYDFMEFGEDALLNPIPWSEETEAAYMPVTNLSAVIVMLKENSEERRLKDPRFAKYAKFLAYLKEVAGRSEVSLNINERMKQAKMEKELSAFHAEVMEEEAEGDSAQEAKNDNRQDLVLNEGLMILADLISVSSPGPAYVSVCDKPVKHTFVQSVIKWFKDTL